MANLRSSIIISITGEKSVNHFSKGTLSKRKKWDTKMTAHWYGLGEHGVPIWRSNQIWLYNNDDRKIIALNPPENRQGLLNCLSGKSKIGTDSAASLSYLIKRYRKLDVIYFSEHWLNSARNCNKIGLYKVVLTESLGSFPYIYPQLALKLRLLSYLSRGIKLLGDYCYFPPL